jgi:putative FmdB family regulatory protein
MPLYLYRCEACGSEEEHIQKFSDPPMTKCEACGGKLSKVITPTAFHLKGGGWYKDLYASSKSDSGSEAKSGGDSGGSSESSKSSSGDSGGTKSSGGDKSSKDSSKKKSGSGKKAAST